MSVVKAVYVVSVPQETRWDGAMAKALVVSLEKVLGLPFALQIVAEPFEITWRVVDMTGVATLEDLQKTIRGFLPEAQIEELSMEDSDEDFQPFYRDFVYYRVAESPVASIPHVTELHNDDPLLAMTNILSTLEAGERIEYTLIAIESPTPEDDKKTWDLLWEYRDKDNLFNFIIGEKVPKHSARVHNAYREKLSLARLRCLLFISVDSPDQQRTRTLSQLLTDQLYSFSVDAFGTVAPTPRDPARKGVYISSVSKAIEYDAFTFYRNRDAYIQPRGELGRADNWGRGEEWARLFYIILAHGEIASLWHLPHKGFTARNIAWSDSAMPEVSEELARNADGLLLGEGVYRGERVPIRILREDRVTHMNIVGRAGVGKSSLLHNLIHQDIANGEGVCVIDPHGDLVRDVLRCSIPAERERDVVVLDFARPEYPVPLNIFAGTQTYASIGRIVGIVEQLYSTSGVQWGKFLRAGVQALQHVPDATFRDIYRLFTDTEFCQWVLDRIDDDLLLDTLEMDYLDQTPARQREIRTPVLNRIDPFHRNPYLRPMLCHPDRIDFGDMMEQQKIVLVSLGVDTEVVPLGEQHMIGAMLVSLLQMAGMDRKRERIPFYVYIDEVQNLARSSPLDVIFSEARKFALYFVVANQYLDQLPDNVLKAFLGNVGATVVYRSNPDDARKISGLLKPQFDAEHLLKLDKYTAAVNMQLHGNTQPNFLLYASPPPQYSDNAHEREEHIRQLSREQYTPKSAAEVNAWFDERYPSRRRRTRQSSGDELSVENDSLDKDDFLE